MHYLSSGDHLVVILVMINISAPSIDFRGKNRLSLAQDSLLSLIFTFVKIVILPVHAEIHEFFIYLIYLMVS